jgi:hypothetical protein
MSKDDMEIEPYYKRTAVEFVDMIYDTKLINPEVKREDTRALDDYIAYMFQSIHNSAKRSIEFSEKMKKYKSLESGDKHE